MSTVSCPEAPGELTLQSVPGLRPLLDVSPRRERRLTPRWEGHIISDAHKPENYSTVSPYLIVRDAEATIDFLRRVLGAVELRRFPDDAGRLMHAEVRIDDTVIMLADAAPPDWPAVPSYVHVYVDDVDETYRRALEAGAESVQEPVRKEDEDRRGGVRDAGGTTWWIATNVE